MNEKPFLTLSGVGGAEYIEKRSRFIATCGPCECKECAQSQIQIARTEHHSARHVCFAVRLHDGYQRYSDDGEPAKTGGFPALKLLEGDEIVNAYICIVRYFGGVKLGTGGLARAYREVSKLALQNAGTTIVKPSTSVRISVPYPTWGKLKYALSSFDWVAIQTTDFSEAIYVELMVENAYLQDLFDDLNDRFRDVSLPSRPEHLHKD